MPKNSGSPFVQWREKAEVTGTELALALDISKTHLGDLERGTSPLSENVLAKIADMGLDAEAFKEKHIAWMDKRKAGILQKLKVSP